MNHNRSSLVASVLQFPVAVILSCVLLSGCDQVQNSAHAEPQSSVPPAAALPKVKIAQPLTQQVSPWDEYIGRIEAVNAVEVRARVSGYLEKVNFTAGATVKKGDLLFQIDSKPFQAQLSYAQAELEQAKARLELAKNDLARAKNLIKAKAISAEEYDGRYKAVREISAAVQAAMAQLETAQLNLNFTQVRAPINGRISRELITAGNLVNGSGGDATRLASIVSTDPVYVYVDVAEQALLKYRRQAQSKKQSLKGTPVELALADEPGFPHRGHLDYIAPMENPATGTISVRGVFANPDDLLSPGYFARLRIRSGQPYTAVLLPERAIATDQADRFVWIMNANKKVSYRKVLLGDKTGELRVIKAGVQSGELVVIEGLQKLKPDTQVEAETLQLSQSNQE